jgi:hypothetical protein
MAVLVLTRPLAGSPPPPETLPVGNAALALTAMGHEVVFGGAEGALVAVPGGWRAWSGAVHALIDRFPSWTWPEDYARARGGLEQLPMGNPLGFRDLCRDKLAFQRECPASMPEVLNDPGDFEAALETWGGAFLKPRFGGLGRGVRYVRPGDALPAALEGAVPGQLEPSILQRAVPAPRGLAALSLRVLMQREVGGWVEAGAVARVSETDPVGNVDRGARALPAVQVCSGATLRRQRSICQQVTDWIEDPQVVEVGLDLVVDPQGRPHLIEANSRPGGRLRALGAEFAEAHLRACARPLLYLCQTVSGEGVLVGGQT